MVDLHNEFISQISNLQTRKDAHVSQLYHVRDQESQKAHQLPSCVSGGTTGDPMRLRSSVHLASTRK